MKRKLSGPSVILYQTVSSKQLSDVLWSIKQIIKSTFRSAQSASQQAYLGVRVISL